uniref:Uncharacterized protein n=1 Tax=Melopsittacus undulatus TaxID=13146 RepID=A0A8V5GWV5_MELUD
SPPPLTIYRLPPSLTGNQPVFPCGGELRGESGYVASEGFPRPYPPNTNCTWSITVPENQSASLSFRVFDLEPDLRCRFDVVSVWGGSGPDPPLLGRYCGTFRPGPLRAPSNRILVRMESDGATNGRGFLAWYSAGPAVGCVGGVLEQPQGTLSSPNWPEHNYPPGVSCTWYIRAPPGKVVELSFRKLDVEPDAHCRYDHVSVFDGGRSDATRRVGRFCGEETPGPIISSGPELLVQFVSDLSVTADGFTASYVHRSPPGPIATPGPIVTPGPIATPEGTSPIACPERCRRTGSLQSSFCASDFVLTGTVKSLTRGPPPDQGWVLISILGLYKGGGALGVPPPSKGTSMRMLLPCRLCPSLKKGSSYILMGRMGEGGGALLPPDAFVVPFRPQQQLQVLTNLSKRGCRGRA